MKAILTLALIGGLSLCAQCLDLTLNNGRVYSNVKIVNKTPDGIDIVSHSDMDILVHRHIRYSELAPDSLKNFPDYDKPKAEAHLADAKAAHEKAVAQGKGSYTKWIADGASGMPVTYPVSSANSMKVVFKATKDLPDGTIGWATSEESGYNPKHFGKIYVHGLKITEGNEWVGKVYLTSKFMIDKRETCPCYATSQEAVAKLEKRGNGLK